MRGREKERERNISVWLPLTRPLLGTWPTTQAPALTGNPTSDPLVHKPALNPLSHPSQKILISLIYLFLIKHPFVCLLATYNYSFLNLRIVKFKTYVWNFRKYVNLICVYFPIWWNMGINQIAFWTKLTSNQLAASRPYYSKSGHLYFQ